MGPCSCCSYANICVSLCLAASLSKPAAKAYKTDPTLFVLFDYLWRTGDVCRPVLWATIGIELDSYYLITHPTDTE